MIGSGGPERERYGEIGRGILHIFTVYIFIYTYIHIFSIYIYVFMYAFVYVMMMCWWVRDTFGSQCGVQTMTWHLCLSASSEFWGEFILYGRTQTQGHTPSMFGINSYSWLGSRVFQVRHSRITSGNWIMLFMVFHHKTRTSLKSGKPSLRPRIFLDHLTIEVPIKKLSQHGATRKWCYQFSCYTYPTLSIYIYKRRIVVGCIPSFAR